MPPGRDPNQTFVTDDAGAPKRGLLVPLLIVGLLIVGAGLLIAWGLNSFFPKLIPKPGSTMAKVEPPQAGAGSAQTPATGATASPSPTGVEFGGAARPSGTTAPPPETPAVVAAPFPAVPPVEAPPTPTPAVIAAAPATPRPTKVASPPDSGPPVEVFQRAVPPEGGNPPVPSRAPTQMAKLDSTPVAAPTAPRVTEAPRTEVPEAGGSIDLDPSNPENAIIKEEVLKRIDVMPDITPENRDKLYLRVERTPGMGRIATVFFDPGDTRLRGPDVQRLREDLDRGPARKLLDDPTVVFVVLGYADKTGGPEVNKRVSQERANAAVGALRTQLKLSNAMHAVAMGSSTMFGTGREQYDKNRVVEIWAVLP